MKPQDFIAKLLPAAQECQRRHGIPASFTLAQAALETGWGERMRGNNLFNIKAGPKWRGLVVAFDTHEVLHGVKVAMKDRFRAYPSWNDSVADRAGFLRDNPRYRDCFNETTGEGWARAVARAGFATAPDYADQLIKVMRGRNMAQYDIPAKEPA